MDENVGYRVAQVSCLYYTVGMKTLAILDQLAAELDAESRKRGISKSDAVRERLERGRPTGKKTDPLADIRELIGSVDDPDLPNDLSARKKHYLGAWGYGRKRSR
ncbi:MAG TPA: hypothetical protein VIY09_00530 [Rhizomicrobium sp.]